MPVPSQCRMERRQSPLLYLIAISCMWGSAYLFLKISSAEFPPLFLAACRAAIAVPILLPICIFRREFNLSKRNLRDMLIIGTLNGWLPNCLAAFGIRSISSAEAGVLQATTPIITGFLAAMLLKGERLSLRTGLGLFGGLMGVILVVTSTGEASPNSSLEGYLLMIGVAISFGAGAVYARWAKPKAPALIASGQLIVAAVVAMLASLLTGESWQADWQSDAVVSVVMLGALSTALPAVLFLVVISRYQAVKVGAASFLQPVWAILLGMVFLSEAISPFQLIGSSIIILSVITVTKQR